MLDTVKHGGGGGGGGGGGEQSKTIELGYYSRRPEYRVRHFLIISRLLLEWNGGMELLEWNYWNGILE